MSDTPTRDPVRRQRIRTIPRRAGKRVRELLKRRDHADVAMPVTDHLAELRRRVMQTIGVVIALFVVAWIYRDGLFAVLDRPLGGRTDIITLAVTEPLFTAMTVCGWASFAAAVPLIVWHAWRYIAPALRAEQRRRLRPYALSIPVMFYIGMAFTYFLILAPAISFLLGLGSDGMEVQLRAREYYVFVATVMVGIGVAFLYPIVLLALGHLGVLRSEQLARNRRVAIFAIACLAAMLPTGDPVSLLLETIPLVALYEISIILLRRQERRRDRELARILGTEAGSTP